MTKLPHSPWGRGCKLQTSTSVYIWLLGSVQTFSGEGAMWMDLSLEESVMGEEKFNDKGAGFSSITIRKQ